jgi:peptidoglycan biosynthesis protein MviN/MurJ (putative lipid II flippase)
LRSFAKIVFCSAIMGVACWLGLHYTAFTIHSRFLVQLLTFLALIIGATGLYLGAAWLFRCHELEEIYGIATRRRAVAGSGGVAES